MVRLERLPATATTSAGPTSAKHQQRVSEKDGEWEAMFGRLQIFKKVKGHCQADQDVDEPELGRWGTSKVEWLLRIYVSQLLVSFVCK